MIDAEKNLIVIWLLNFTIRMFVKSAVKSMEQNLDLTKSSS